MSQGTEFVRSWLEAQNVGDVELLIGMCHQDVEPCNPDGTFRRADGVRANFKPVIEATFDRRSEVRTIAVKGDIVVTEFVTIGRHSRLFVTPQGEVRPTDKDNFRADDRQLRASRWQARGVSKPVRPDVPGDAVRPAACARVRVMTALRPGGVAFVPEAPR